MFFLLGHPLFTLALIGMAFVIWRTYRHSFGATASTQRAFEAADTREPSPPSAREVTGWVDALRSSDPEFDLVTFLDQVKGLFLRVQAAWAAGDLGPVRRDLSDATFQRFRVQLELMRAQAVRNVTADMAVLDLQAVGLERTTAFDTLHVRIRAQARDVDVPVSLSPEEGLERARRAPLEPFIEVWSFVRRPGTRSRKEGLLQPGKCPSCGAPFEGGAAGNCTYCGAIVNSGAYDWVLAEITQGVEAGSAPLEVPGLEALRAVDPALSLEVLEDRASLLFWGWIDAQARGEPGRMAKLATADFLAEMAADVAGLRSRRRARVFLQAAVGSVAVRAIQDGADTTLAQVEIRWSARMGVVPEGTSPGTLATLPQRWVFTLARKAGARTDQARGMATARCGNCGAPLGDSVQPTCEHCGQTLNDGAHDWVLANAEPFEVWTARSRAQSTPKAPAAGPAGRDTVMDAAERQRLLYTMAAMAAADGGVDERERRMLKLCAERWGVPFENVEVALEADPALFERLVPPPGPAGESFLRSLVQIALVDGKVDRQERRMLESAAARLGLKERLPELLARFGLG
ncbi:MAG TPA: TIM44-like domain-containing protein [Myxococcaceae bacterium]|nr:TIM44-like domain-containing protein [Myxococcaceae bacterium]